MLSNWLRAFQLCSEGFRQSDCRAAVGGKIRVWGKIWGRIGTLETQTYLNWLNFLNFNPDFALCGWFNRKFGLLGGYFCLTTNREGEASWGNKMISWKKEYSDIQIFWYPPGWCWPGLMWHWWPGEPSLAALAGEMLSFRHYQPSLWLGLAWATVRLRSEWSTLIGPEPTRYCPLIGR